MVCLFSNNNTIQSQKNVSKFYFFYFTINLSINFRSVCMSVCLSATAILRSHRTTLANEVPKEGSSQGRVRLYFHGRIINTWLPKRQNMSRTLRLTLT